MCIRDRVGATGVQNNLELLWRRTNLDLGEVLGVQEVADGDRVALLGLEGLLLEHLFHVTLRPDAHVLLAQGLHVVADVGILELLRQRDFLQTVVLLACSLDDAVAQLLGWLETRTASCGHQQRPCRPMRR